MRVAIGAILQETNTFSPIPGTLDHFRGVYCLRGEEIPERLRDSSTEMSGFYDVLEASDHQIVPTIAAMAVSSGRLQRVAYETLRDELFDRLVAEGLPDAVLLALHGAMSLEDEDDGDGRLLAELRSVVGVSCPVFVTHDLHANLTRQKVRLCDALVGYHTAPHVDHRCTGARAAGLLLRTLATGQKPRNHLRKIPMMAPSVKMNTAISPLKQIIERARELEKNPATPAVSVFWMQPWLDVEEAGAAVNVVSYGEIDEAEEVLRELSDRVWNTRHELDLTLWKANDAIQDALQHPGGPCVFADTGDSPAGGGPGDSNFLLSSMVDASVDQRVYLPLLDAKAVHAMHAAGLGARLKLKLGGSIDQRSYSPREFEGRVEGLSDGRFVYQGPIAKGQEAHIGLAGVFAIGETKVLVHERPAFSHDPSIFRCVGLDVKDAKIVVAKSPTQFRTCYEPIARKIYEIETPGICTVNLRSLDYVRIPRPMFPFDPEEQVERKFRNG